MASLIFILLYLIICYIFFGLTKSISDTHYKWVKKFGFWGYPIFPTTMITWSILVMHELKDYPGIILGGIGIMYVGIYAAFKYSKVIEVKHYAGALIGIVSMMYVVWVWCCWIAYSFIGLSLFSLKSKYKIYIIEILAIISLYLFSFFRGNFTMVV